MSDYAKKRLNFEGRGYITQPKCRCDPKSNFLFSGRRGCTLLNPNVTVTLNPTFDFLGGVGRDGTLPNPNPNVTDTPIPTMILFWYALPASKYFLHFHLLLILLPGEGVGTFSITKELNCSDVADNLYFVTVVHYLSIV